MELLHSIDDLELLHNRLIEDTDPKISTIVIPASTCAQASGANDIIRVAKKEILKKKLTEKIQLRVTGCHGFCQMEPNVLIEPRGTFYPTVNMKDMARIVEAVAEDEVLDDLLYTDSNTGKHIEKAKDIPFFKMQARTIMGQNDKVDPIRIYNYIEVGGYLSFAG
ncbi:MAG: (2Fe-2S) ferredoxin domain-containing protein, partial [Deltaproteobacteria bacterium]|nr:(2Fe-2S) ferredoxin domain-containing protein [Deltaproteobacteria bacterium]